MALFNRTNPRFPMAPEDTEANGGAGASAPDPAATKTEDPVLKALTEMSQRIEQSNKALDQRLGQVEQFATRFNQALEAQSQKRPAGDDSPVEVDPDTQRFIDEKLRSVNQGQMAVADQVDMIQFNNLVSQTKVKPEVVKQALGLHANWQKQGITLAGQPLSRADALKFVLGHQTLAGSSTDAVNLPDAEENRREGNRHAITESGSRAAKGEIPKDPEKMTRQERLKNYWSDVLDKEGF